MGKTTSRFAWRHQYDEDRDEREGLLAGTVNDADSLTQQHHAEAADVNVLAQRFGLDKKPLPTVPQNPAWYGDFSNVPDLRTALEITNDAKNRFMALPPKLRARFQNSPAELWGFIQDPDNWEEAVRLGLLTKAPEPKKEPAEPAPKTPLDRVSTGT